MNRITRRLHGELGEPDDVALRLPSGITVFPNPKWDIGTGVAMARLAAIEDILGEEYNLEQLCAIIGTGSASMNGVSCQECGERLKIASAETLDEDGSSESMIGYCEGCGSSFRWKRSIELAREYDVERYFVG